MLNLDNDCISKVYKSYVKHFVYCKKYNSHQKSFMFVKRYIIFVKILRLLETVI